MKTWQTISRIITDTLINSRVQLHYAIQFIAATGAALAEPLPDYSHTSLAWNPALEVFVGTAIQTTQPFQVALMPVSLTLVLLNQQGEAIAALPLHGKTMAEGLTWLQQESAKLGADANKIVFLDYPPNDFPDHPLAHGDTFDATQTPTLQELTDYYANTYGQLQDMIATVEDATAVRIWPHHFDMATLIMLPGMRDGIPLTVGVGLSPGDTSYDEPYWYVSPYPYPDTTHLPGLEGEGFWHTQSWVGAVLKASQLAQTAEAQQNQLKAFLHSALHHAIALLQPGLATPA